MEEANAVHTRMMDCKARCSHIKEIRNDLKVFCVLDREAPPLLVSDSTIMSLSTLLLGHMRMTCRLQL